MMVFSARLVEDGGRCLSPFTLSTTFTRVKSPCPPPIKIAINRSLYSNLSPLYLSLWFPSLCPSPVLLHSILMYIHNTLPLCFHYMNINPFHQRNLTFLLYMESGRGSYFCGRLSGLEGSVLCVVKVDVSENNSSYFQQQR
jgi:hypothetical protein